MLHRTDIKANLPLPIGQAAGRDFID